MKNMLTVQLGGKDKQPQLELATGVAVYSNNGVARLSLLGGGEFAPTIVEVTREDVAHLASELHLLARHWDKAL